VSAAASGRFITGTCTEVGKSFVTACLASAARSRGVGLTAAKPLATGGPPPGDDAVLIAQAAGHPPQVMQCLPDPAAPARAARNAGTELDAGALLRWCRALPTPRLIEGVGGWEVPLARGYRVSDLAAELGHPVVVVAANRLGVLNHSLLTVEAVRRCGLALAGLVLVDQPQPTALQDWNHDDLCELLADTGVQVLRMPWSPEGTPSAELGAPLLAALWPGLLP
jgi:dethiobiotin synthetase